MGKASRRRAQGRTERERARARSHAGAHGADAARCACCEPDDRRCERCGSADLVSVERFAHDDKDCPGCVELRAGPQRLWPDQPDELALWPDCPQCREALAHDLANLTAHVRALARLHEEPFADCVLAYQACAAAAAALLAHPPTPHERRGDDAPSDVELARLALAAAAKAAAKRDPARERLAHEVAEPALARLSRSPAPQARAAARAGRAALSAAAAARLSRDGAAAPVLPSAEAAVVAASHALARERTGPRPDLVFDALREVADGLLDAERSCRA